MGKTLADLYTPGGYPLDEVASALQKTIRRGEEVQALFWASESYRERSWWIGWH